MSIGRKKITVAESSLLKNFHAKSKTAALGTDQNIGTITLEEALNLFLLPKNLGIYKGEEVEVNNGRFGPYVRFGKIFVSLPKGEDPLDVTMERAKEIIDEKNQADAPIGEYEGLPIQKGVGRFGPFIKWNGMFINVSKKYNFDKLSQSDLNELIEDKQQKEIDKVIHDWKTEGIKVEKARWGRSIITKGKIKIELSKDVDAEKLTLAQVQELIEKKAPALAIADPHAQRAIAITVVGLVIASLMWWANKIVTRAAMGIK